MAYILHSDINSAYASIELVYRPQLRDKPVAVGGDEESRHGIVLAKNLLAKKHGVKTGMALWEARQCCSKLVVLPPNFPLYMRTSRLIREIYREYSDKVEPFGIDEAWVDVSGMAFSMDDAAQVADEIRRRILAELGLTVSIGASWNKPFAKLGSDMKKPYGLTVITPDNYMETVWPLPVSDLLNVGPARTKVLERKSIRTIGQLATADPHRLKLIFGVVGHMLWVFANGHDVSPVAAAGNAPMIKSVGNSFTFPRDLGNDEDVRMGFFILAESVAARMRENGFECRTVSISVRDAGLTSFIRQRKLARPSCLASELVDAAMRLFASNYRWHDHGGYYRPIRSMGLHAMDLSPAGGAGQLSIFVDEQQRIKKERKEVAMDLIRDRYGYQAVQRAVLLQDRQLAGLDARSGNVIHPVGYFYTP